MHEEISERRTLNNDKRGGKYSQFLVRNYSCFNLKLENIPIYLEKPNCLTIKTYFEMNEKEKEMEIV